MAHHVEPLVDFVFFGAISSRTRSTRISPPPPGMRVEPGVAQARERLPHGQLRAARDVLDLGRGERVQVDPVALLDRAEEVLVVVDPEVGVVAALHQDAGAADRERLLDLLEDDRLREQVALVAVAGAPVEGAEVAVGDADVRVVEVPVDDERDPVGIGLAPAAARRPRGRPRRARASAAASTASSSEIRSPSSAFSSTARTGVASTVVMPPPPPAPSGRSAAPARARARRRRAPSRGRCRARRARAGRRSSGASRSSGRG